MKTLLALLTLFLSTSLFGQTLLVESRTFYRAKDWGRPGGFGGDGYIDFAVASHTLSVSIDSRACLDDPNAQREIHVTLDTQALRGGMTAAIGRWGIYNLESGSFSQFTQRDDSEAREQQAAFQGEYNLSDNFIGSIWRGEFTNQAIGSFSCNDTEFSSEFWVVPAGQNGSRNSPSFHPNTYGFHFLYREGSIELSASVSRQLMAWGKFLIPAELGVPPIRPTVSSRYAFDPELESEEGVNIENVDWEAYRIRFRD